MNNKKIIGVLKRTVKFMELHGENEFKIRGYQNAIQILERHHDALIEKSLPELQEIDGIGKSIAQTLKEIAENGSSTQLNEYISKTPAGLIELMGFRGMGIKKLRTLWADFNIEDKSALKELLASQLLLKAKGFGQKTVENIEAVVEFAYECEGKIYYADAEVEGNKILQAIRTEFSDCQASFVGPMRRKLEVVDAIELLVDIPLLKLSPFLATQPYLLYDMKKSGPFTWRGQTLGEIKVVVTIYPTTRQKFTNNLLLKTGSQEHLNWQHGEIKLIDHIKLQDWASEQDCYREFGAAYCPPETREGDWEITLASEGKMPELLKLEDLKGIIHTHTIYSDGLNTPKEMATKCQTMGYEYLGISDHSKAASFYANGMFEERVARQQQEIDLLNKDLSGFRILKGIEADILADGALDYDNTTLATFDFVVASIHSGLSMDKIKATERLITAIANPFTTILGHMTGRILLERIGYPVDHEAIINACAQFGVIIEINAHPKRLDIDWRWVHKALDKGVLLSVNPDAHAIDGFDDMYYGVCVGRKGGLTKAQTFNAWSLEKVVEYLENRKKLIGKS